MVQVTAGARKTPDIFSGHLIVERVKVWYDNDMRVIIHAIESKGITIENLKHVEGNAS